MKPAAAASLHALLSRAGIAFDRSDIADVPVAVVVQDSRRVVPGSVFVAARGPKTDGNDFAADACKSGAVVIVTDAATGPAAVTVPVIRVANARLAYGTLNHVLFGAPSERMTMVGVTGTNGKTTSVYLLREILGPEKPAGVIGTISYEFGGHAYPASHTTPDAAELQALFRDMAQDGCKLIAMEVSSHALDQERLAGIRYDAALFTNLTRDHLDYHGTMENYLEAKAKLFGLLKSGAAGVVNADDPACERMRKAARLSVTYAIDAPADYKAENIETSLQGSRFDVVADAKRVRFDIPLIGRHNIYNVLGAATVAATLGTDLAVSAERLKRFAGVPGRLERIEAGQDFTLFIDYAHTDDGLKNVLASLKPYVARELLVVFGCGGDRDRGKRPKMARVAESYADFVVLTSDNPRHEDPKAILKEVAGGFSAGFRQYELQPDRGKAIRRALLKARKGDVVLLAGKGHESCQVVGDIRLPFSDKEESLKVLQGR